MAQTVHNKAIECYKSVARPRTVAQGINAHTTRIKHKMRPKMATDYPCIVQGRLSVTYVAGFASNNT